MNRRHSALAVAVLLGITGFGVSHAASATGAITSSTDTTDPDDTESDTTEAGETTEATDTTEAEDTTEAPDTTEAADTTEATETTEAFPEWEPEPIEWTPGVVEGSEEGYLEVPIDYANPDDGTLRIFVTRHPATNQSERIGSLLVNPGGPGFTGHDWGTFADQIFTEDLVEHFDIIGFDPRGVGLSEPAIDCIDDYDQFFPVGDITPDDDAERQELIDLAEDFTTACVDNNAEIYQFVGTNNAARDMDAMRRALGEDEISFYGFSYGSELGGVWTTLFPDTVRAAVFSGASDPNAEPLEHSLQQSAGFEAALTTYLAQCSDDPECAFHNDGDAEGAFDALMLKLDAKPIPSVPGRPVITRAVALRAADEALYYEDTWPLLSQALADALQGNGAGLLALWDSYFQYSGDGWSNEVEAFVVISCIDDADRPTVEESDAVAPQFNEVAPRLRPATVGDYMCTFFPESTDPRVEITGEGAGPIVVCGTTGDPSTPLQSTRNMAAALEDGRLIVVESNNHTCGGVSACADEIIDDYLVDLIVPAEVTECPGDD